jgi:heme-degrading monooxygenase HmoA
LQIIIEQDDTGPNLWITRGAESARFALSASGGGLMIARVWRGYTIAAHADDYESMLKPELLPGLSRVKGFRGSYLLRRPQGSEVEFITIILWDSLDDVRAVAGADYERAVIPEERRKYLARHDAKAAHYEVVAKQDRS